MIFLTSKWRPQAEVGIPPMPLPPDGLWAAFRAGDRANRCPASVNLQGLVRQVNETVL